MGVSELNTHITNAKTFMAARNWASAELEVAQAEAELAALPDSTKGDRGLRFQRDAVRFLRKMCTGHAGAKAGIQRELVEYRGST